MKSTSQDRRDHRIRDESGEVGELQRWDRGRWGPAPSGLSAGRGRARFFFAVLLGVGSWLSLPAAGQQDLFEQSLVVARDLWLPEEQARRALEGRLMVQVADEKAEIVGVEEPSLHEPPWTIVLYFDRALGETRDLKDGAKRLAGEAARLARLGTVHVLVADEDTVSYRIPATRDAYLLDSALSWMVANLTAEALPSVERFELARAAPKAHRVGAGLRREVAFVDSRIDHLLGQLLELAPAVGRRLLIPVGLGFEEDPRSFYASLLAPEETLDCLAETDGVWPGRSGELARTVSALGWQVVALEPPPEDEGPAFSLGQLDFGYSGNPEMPWAITFHEDREPKKARAYLALAQAQLEAGDVAQAEKSVRSALRFFDRGKKTRAEEARAWLLLGELLAATDRGGSFGRAFDEAGKLVELAEIEDPEIDRLSQVRVHSRQPLLQLAAATGQQIGEDDDDLGLSQTLDELEKAWRLTYQLPDPLAPGLLRVELLGKNGKVLRQRWTSTARPARALEVLVEQESPGERLELQLHRTESPALLRVTALDSSADESLPVAEWRAVIVVATCDGSFRAREAAVEVVLRQEKTTVLEVVVPDGLEPSAVLLEERFSRRIGRASL